MYNEYYYLVLLSLLIVPVLWPGSAGADGLFGDLSQFKAEGTIRAKNFSERNINFKIDKGRLEGTVFA